MDIDDKWIKRLDILMKKRGFTEFMPGNDVGPAYDREDIGPHLWFKKVNTITNIDDFFPEIMLSTDCVPFYLSTRQMEGIEDYLDNVFIPMLQSDELYSVLVASRDSGMWDHPFERKKMGHKFTERVGLEIFEYQYSDEEIRAFHGNRMGQPTRTKGSNKRLPRLD